MHGLHKLSLFYQNKLKLLFHLSHSNLMDPIKPRGNPGESSEVSKRLLRHVPGEKSELSSYMKPTDTYLTPTSIPGYLLPSSVPSYLPPPSTYVSTQHFYSSDLRHKKKTSRPGSLLSRTISGFLERTKIMSSNTVSLPLPVCKFLDSCKCRGIIYFIYSRVGI